jgi:protein-S-isoprenylcysteine O-methyltransferase Ste14
MARIILRTVLGAVLLGLLLFLPAGTTAWAGGWWFLVLVTGCSMATAIWLALSPALRASHMASPVDSTQTARDRTLIGILLLALAGWLPLMALDACRFGWSHVPAWAQVLGGALVLAAFAGMVWVLRVNPIAAVTARVQTEQGQAVVTLNPYAIVRHPLYTFVLPFLVGTPLLLGSLWGLAGLALFVPLLAARLLGEEQVLDAGLLEYRDYCEKVRCRLVPGLW